MKCYLNGENIVGKDIREILQNILKNTQRYKLKALHLHILKLTQIDILNMMRIVLLVILQK